GAAHAGEVVEWIVANEDPLHVSAHVGIVSRQNVQPGSSVTDDILLKGDVLDRRPRSPAVLVAYGEEDGVAVLGRLPRVLEDIPFDENAAGVLDLEEVLHRRPHAAPRRRLEEMILPDLDVRGRSEERRVGKEGRFRVCTDDGER